MGENTAIEWATHTFNPWTGCLRVSPACDNCYAAAQAKRSPRTFGSWEPGAERKRTSEAYWRQPLAWNRKAEAEGRRARVFCASMADVFDNAVPVMWRNDLWDLIERTPHLDWLLLTKRPQLIAKMLPYTGWDPPWPNVWLGTTVENQAEADRRIPQLLAVPAARRFLSCEPLLGPLRIRQWLMSGTDPGRCANCGRGHGFTRCPNYGGVALARSPMDGNDFGCSTFRRQHFALDWVIAGGESGPGARASHPAWFRSLRDQCAAAGVSFFFKQWGDWAPVDPSGDAPFPNGWRALRGHGGSPPARDELYPDRDAAFVARYGKKAAGRLLDGVQHDAAPHG
jgi:protein gp37